MGFETKVLAAVEQAVPGVDAHFYGGALFVATFSDEEAPKVKDAVAQVVTCDVKVSKFGHKDPVPNVRFVLDFVPFVDERLV